MSAYLVVSPGMGCLGWQVASQATSNRQLAPSRAANCPKATWQVFFMHTLSATVVKTSAKMTSTIWTFTTELCPLGHLPKTAESEVEEVAVGGVREGFLSFFASFARSLMQILMFDDSLTHDLPAL